MSPLIEIVLLLIVAKILGELAERAGFPALIGEVGAGALLGPLIFNLVSPNETIEFLATIGIITLLFISGAQINLQAFSRTAKPGAYTAVAGVAVPLVAGVSLGVLAGFPPIETLFLGIALSVTSIGISVRTLIDLHQLKSEVGMIIVSAAVIDDVIGIVLLALLTAVAGGATGVASLLPTFAAMAIFLVAIFTLGKPVMGWIFEKAQKAHTHEMSYSAALLIALVTAVLSNSAGLHYAIGAFIAGLLLGDHIRKDRMLFDSLIDFSFGFFVTIFFASIGLLFSRESGAILLPFILILVLVAFGTKIVGGMAGSFPALRDLKRSFLVGLGLCPRGEIGLVVAKISLLAGIITGDLFTAVTLMIIASILISPLLLTAGFGRAGYPTRGLQSEGER
ncbi:MAG: cation:proton antiporter [Methanoregulaceae archaeon]|jgi:Kef-type K+ transport system membrane component KefB